MLSLLFTFCFSYSLLLHKYLFNGRVNRSFIFKNDNMGVIPRENKLKKHILVYISSKVSSAIEPERRCNEKLFTHDNLFFPFQKAVYSLIIK